MEIIPKHIDFIPTSREKNVKHKQKKSNTVISSSEEQTPLFEYTKFDKGYGRYSNLNNH